ncbi:hypothetical protein EWM64_g5756 [Hericium alpestre]|uniref:Uncharacterized protein n=1 Tax=Hericium alpestre TaxID=135208 RepID=A0A4Y9ZTM2_9AGAM|nr:hypothetical protein EWM64_g5756 [Hericium alpestre]
MKSALDDTFVETLRVAVQPRANQLIERLHRGVLRARDKVKFSVFKSKATGILAVMRMRNAIRYAQKAEKKPSITVIELFKQLKLFDHAIKNHLKVLRFKNMFKATMPNEIRAGVDKMLQFEVQVPQLGSLNKLRMNEQFILGDASSTVSAYLQY